MRGDRPSSWPSTALFDGHARPSTCDADRRAARTNRGLRGGRATCCARASRRTRFYVIRRGARGDRDLRPAARARCTLETLARRRRARLVLAVPALPLALRRARPRRRREPSRSTARCLRGKCEADHELGYDTDAALRRGDAWSACRHPAAAARRLRRMSPAEPRAAPMTPAPFRVRGARRGRPRTPGRWSSSPQDGRRCRASRPGQFAMLYAFGVGEVPISISGDLSAGGRSCTRSARSARSRAAICARARPGDGGRARPVRHAPGRWTRREGGDVVVVAGGVGLAPLRPVVYHAAREPRALRPGGAPLRRRDAGGPALSPTSSSAGAAGSTSRSR